MCDVEDEITDIDVGVELLADFAGQRCCVCFALVNLAAGKFPQTGEVDAFLPACDEERAVSFDHRRYDNDHFVAVFVAATLTWPIRGNDVHARVIGHASHFGFRAVQIVAPKSINA